MGLITGILGLPLAPLRGTVWAAEQIRRQAEEEFYDPARIRLQLEEVARRRAAGADHGHHRQRLPAAGGLEGLGDPLSQGPPAG